MLHSLNRCEILRDDANELRTVSVKVEPKLEFRPRGRFFQISCLGHTSTVDRDICIKFSVWAENWLLQRVERSKYAVLEIQDGRCRLRWSTFGHKLWGHPLERG